MAYETLNSCNCECACTKCLIDRRSQWYLNYLNRKKALEWIELEYKSRVAPEEILKSVPTAYAITTDFATEMYQALRNKDVLFAQFFVDNNLKDWEQNDFPFSQLIQELKLSVVLINYVTDGKIDLSS